jgi:hypothetical protein
MEDASPNSAPCLLGASVKARTREILGHQYDEWDKQVENIDRRGYIQAQPDEVVMPFRTFHPPPEPEPENPLRDEVPKIRETWTDQHKKTCDGSWFNFSSESSDYSSCDSSDARPGIAEVGGLAGAIGTKMKDAVDRASTVAEPLARMDHMFRLMHKNETPRMTARESNHRFAEGSDEWMYPRKEKPKLVRLLVPMFRMMQNSMGGNHSHRHHHHHHHRRR